MAQTIDQQIEEIRAYIRKTPYHKGTEREIGLLKAKIAKLKAKKEADAMRGSSGRGISYAVKKQGDATIVLVGPPSAGKSTLLNALTNAESKVAPYAFTTVSVIPGMMNYHDAYIQVLDVPGLIEGAEEGKGRGREVLSVVRGADLLVLMSDIDRPEAIERIANALENNGIRIDKTAPDVRIVKKIDGGVLIKSNIRQDFDAETVKDIAREMGIKNGEIQLRQKVTEDQLIDAFSRNRVYIPSIRILNKAEQVIANPQKMMKQSMGNLVYISADKNINLNVFREAIWKKLGLCRIYLVRRDEEPHTNSPLIVPSHYTIKDVAQSIGSEFAQGKTSAKIWGDTAKFDGQTVSLKTKVREDMIVRII